MKIGHMINKRNVAIGVAILLIGLMSIAIITFVGLLSERSFTMPTNGMRPTIVAGDRVVADMTAYDAADPGIGDLVVFIPKGFSDRKWVFRIAALPGDTLAYEHNVLKRNGETIFSPAFDDQRRYSPAHVADDPFLDGVTGLASDEYFMLSDDPEHFNDSRAWGSIPRENIIGKVVSHD